MRYLVFVSFICMLSTAAAVAPSQCMFFLFVFVFDISGTVILLFCRLVYSVFCVCHRIFFRFTLPCVFHATHVLFCVLSRLHLLALPYVVRADLSRVILGSAGIVCETPLSELAMSTPLIISENTLCPAGTFLANDLRVRSALFLFS